MENPTINELNLLHANICQALGDPKRILILYALNDSPRHVTGLAEDPNMPQPTVSRHLRVLRQRALVTTERTGTYAKSNKGLPAESVDLALVAQSVTTPTRLNCGGCHFNGGGGNAVKHGDLDSSLLYPTENIDVHMGRYDFQCIDCHKTEDHEISGHMISVSATAENRFDCTEHSFAA